MKTSIFENQNRILFLLMAFSFFLIGLWDLKSIKTDGMILPVLLGIICLMGIPMVLFSIRSSELFSFCKVNKGDGKYSLVLFGLITICGAGLAFAQGELMNVFKKLGWPDFTSPEMNGTAEEMFKNRFGLLFIVFIVLIPAIDEFIFRKCMLSLLIKKAVPFSFFVVSAIYALVHSGSNLFSMSLVFLASMQLNYLYFKTVELIYPIFLNYAYNFSCLYLFKDLKFDFSLWVHLAGILFSILFLILLNWFLTINFKNALLVERREVLSGFNLSVCLSLLFLVFLKIVIFSNFLN